MRRDALIFLAALLGLLVALGISALTAATAATQLRGYADPTASDALPDWTPRLGFNADLRLYEGEALTATLDQMRSLGGNWVRQPVSWADIEPAPGQYDWAEWDRIFAPFAGDPDLRVVAVLQNAPAWAADPAAPDAATAPPADPAAFAQFASAFAARYADAVDFYQIWDEPNLQSGWGGLRPASSCLSGAAIRRL